MDDEDLNEIFADYEAIRNNSDSAAVNNEQTDANETESSQAAAAAVRKRIIRKPRLKLNAERLCGERGIPILEKHFENIYFEQTKGCEKENLDKLMSHLEHWTHRLFPSLKFSESLLHIEKLGKKKPVQVCIKKLRLNMPILDEDFVRDGEDDIDDDQRNLEMDVDEPPESAFDQLMKEHRETFPETTDTVGNTTVTPVSSYYNPPLSPPRSTTAITLSPPRSAVEKEELTEEQKQRIERNKMLAAERRKLKLAAMNTSLTSDTSHDVSDSPKDMSDVSREVLDTSSKDLHSKDMSDVSKEVLDTSSKDLHSKDMSDVSKEVLDTSSKDLQSLSATCNDDELSTTNFVFSVV